MNLTIRRKKWLRGSMDLNGGILRNTSGSMCCLGFLGKACGLKNEDMLYKPDLTYFLSYQPFRLSENTMKKFKAKMPKKFTERIETQLIKVNDTTGMPLKERELKITKLMKKLNINVKFI